MRDSWALPTQRYLKRAVAEFFLTFKLMKENTAPREDFEHYLQSGQIRYVDGVFVGTIPAAIAFFLKEHGAVWDTPARGWRIPLGMLPHRTRLIVQAQVEKNEKTKLALLAALMLAPAMVESFLDDSILKTFGEEIADDVYRSVSYRGPTLPPARAIPTYDVRVRDAMRRIAQKEAERMADKIEDIHARGGDVEAYLAKRKKVMEYKAQVAARSEMGIEANETLASFHISEGQPYYRWHTKGDEIVRLDHRELDNSVQRWDTPPIVDKRTGYRGHPGSAANCRCEAIPLKKGPE